MLVAVPVHSTVPMVFSLRLAPTMLYIPLVIMQALDSKVSRVPVNDSPEKPYVPRLHLSTPTTQSARNRLSSYLLAKSGCMLHIWRKEMVIRMCLTKMEKFGTTSNPAYISPLCSGQT